VGGAGLTVIVLPSVVMTMLFTSIAVAALMEFSAMMQMSRSSSTHPAGETGSQLK
jgi:hypothetical protein